MNESENITTSVAEAASNAGASFVEKTSSFIAWLKSFVTWENIFKLIGIILIVFVFWIIYRLILRAIKKVPAKKLSAQKSEIIRRFVKYAFYVLVYAIFDISHIAWEVIK